MRRTREWIVRSFNRLVLSRPYDSIQVGEIIDGAGVGRSTFYEHFRDKDALLSHSMAHLLGVLADGVTTGGDVERIRGVLEHFKENRGVVLALLGGASARRVSEELADQIERRLGGETGSGVSSRLAAGTIADMQLAMVRRWLEKTQGCSSQDAAAALCRSSRASTGAFVQ